MSAVRALAIAALALGGVALAGGPARAQSSGGAQPGGTSPPPLQAAPLPPASPPPSAPSSHSSSPAGAADGPGAAGGAATGAFAGAPGGAGGPPVGAAAAPAPAREVPVADAAAAATDHDAVVGAWGVEVRRIDAGAALSLRPGTGCVPSATTAPACPAAELGALSVRHWLSRNVAVTAGLALVVGGGRGTMERALDTHFGGGPTGGVSVLLGSWRHLAVSASPDLTVVLFKPSGSSDTAYLGILRSDLEAELQFGFIGLPALSVAIRSGITVRLESGGGAGTATGGTATGSTTVWSIGIAGATTAWSVIDQLVLRYYF